MISVRMSVTEGAATRRVSIRAATLTRALELAGYGRPGRVVSVKHPAPARQILDDDISPGLSPEPACTHRSTAAAA